MTPSPTDQGSPATTTGPTRTGVVLIAAASLALGAALALLLPRLLQQPSAVATGAHTEHQHAEETGALWTCAMHPEVLESKPGSCPICGMDLVASQTESPRDGELGASDGLVIENNRGTQTQLWTCSMHPEVLQDDSGPCPICGMDLVPIDAVRNGTSRDKAIVRIDPTVTQNMNVRSELAQRRDLVRPIRTVGYLDYDQQRMVTVTTKYSGWIERVFVNYVGEEVKAGQALFEIYSPELVQTEQELLSALAFAREMQGAPEDARQRAESLVASARQRLKYWDVPDARVNELERSGEIFRTLEIRAPRGGLVMMRQPGLEGMAVRPGMELFHLANLSSLWLSVELFENQIAFVRPGTQAEIDLPYFPGESFSGKVRFLEPALSEETRTVSARIEVANRGGRLRKGMYATVDLQPVAIPDALAVPSSAVLRTGRRNLVVVDLGEGRYVPREVTLGYEADAWVQILSGLASGERVLTSAQFLIDSESRLRSAVQAAIGERATQTRKGAQLPPTSAHQH